MHARERERKRDRSATGTMNHSTAKKPHTSKSSSSQSPYHEASDLLNRILNKIEISSSTKNKKLSSHHSNKSNTNYTQLLKSSVTNKEGKLQVSSKTYAIVAKVLQNKSKIDHLITETNILKTDSNSIKNMGLFYIMLYELLFASSSSSSSQPHKGIIKGGGTVKRYILQYEAILREKYQEYYGTTHKNAIHHIDDEEEEEKDQSSSSSRQQQHRYVRVNTCVTTTHEFLQLYHTMMLNTENQEENTSTVPSSSSLSSTTATATMERRIYRDEHIPDLFVIPSHDTSKLLSTLTNQTKGNQIVLQDKSSCIPAYCLYSLLLQQQQQQQSHPSHTRFQVLDACAAPGNKTSHVAALLSQLPSSPQSNKKNKKSLIDAPTSDNVIHKIYAIDRDPERCQILQDRMKVLVPPNNSMDVLVRNKDFLTISGTDDDDTNQNEYANLTCIVLDPSCSGSGLYHRNGTSNDTKKGSTTMQQSSQYLTNHDNPQQQQRIQKLSNFQITCLRHALTSFPNVHTVIYSTCSVHVLENEHVVASVFGTNSSNADDCDKVDTKNIRDEWSIVAPPDLQNWKRRGVDLRHAKCEGSDDDKVLKELSSDEPDVTDLYGDLTNEEINCFIRTNHEDRTNGFFVACFQRKNIVQSPNKKRKSRLSDSTKHVTPDSQNLPIYNGEFDHMVRQSNVITTGHGTRNNRTVPPVKSNVMDATTNKKRKVETTKTGVAETTTTSTFTTNISDVTGTTSVSNHCKKRAKKLEWKQRQHDAKRLRTKIEKVNQNKKK